MSGRFAFPLRALITALLLSGAAVSQNASFQTFGSSCGPINLALTARGLPQFGQTLVVEYSGPFGSGFIGPIVQTHQPFLAIGASDSSFGGLTLPWNVPVAVTGGNTGCQLLVSVDVVVVIPLSAGPAVEHPLSIPNVPSAAGIPFFVQWILHSTRFDQRTGVRTTMLATSNAGRAVLGF